MLQTGNRLEVENPEQLQVRGRVSKDGTLFSMLLKRLTVILATFALLVGGLTISNTASNGVASAQSGSTQTIKVERVASWQGCNWGGCSVKLDKAETTAIAAGASVYISVLGIHWGAGFAALAAYAIERGYCLRLTFNPLRGPGRGVTPSLVRC